MLRLSANYLNQLTYCEYFVLTQKDCGRLNFVVVSGRGIENILTKGIRMLGRLVANKWMVGLLIYVSAVACQGVRPTDLGIENNSLKMCPPSPNCVTTSVPSEDEHYIKPLPKKDGAQHSIEVLQAIVNDMPRTTIIEKSDRYLRAEFISTIFRFVDDVEFYVDDRNELVQLRSASRIGYSDLGANRERVESIRRRYLAYEKPSAH